MIRLCASPLQDFVGSATNPYSSPESLGLVCASVYILLLILFIPFAFSDVFVNDQENRSKHGLVITEFPHQKVCPYTSTSVLTVAE